MQSRRFAHRHVVAAVDSVLRGRRAWSLPIEKLEERRLLSLTVPTLNSLPGAPAAIFLDFDGDTRVSDGASWGGYDIDGDRNNFSAQELTNINEIWAGVSEAYRPFNINVTTVQPSAGFPQTHAVISRDWSGGVAGIGTFPQDQTQALIGGGPTDDVAGVIGTADHEVGHTMGLSHQSLWDLEGNLSAAYTIGYGTPPEMWSTPVMGAFHYLERPSWWFGHPEYSPSINQDDLNVIANKIAPYVGGTGYRADDYAGTTGSATALTASGGIQSASGILTSTSDVDMFSFTSTGGQTTLYTKLDNHPMINPQLSLYNSSGTLIAQSNTGALTIDEGLTVNLNAGTYYLGVSSHGDYAEIGSYTVQVASLPAEWTDGDIGFVRRSGNTTLSGSTYTTLAGGAGIVGTADAFHFTNQTFSGDATLTARVASISNFDDAAYPQWGDKTKSGIMIRNSSAPDARMIFIGLTSSGLTMDVRTSPGGSITSTAGPAVSAPYWVQLTRSGSTFTAKYSSNGTSWTTLGTASISMTTGVQGGLAATSGWAGNFNINEKPPLVTSTFDNVSLVRAAAVSLSQPWSSLPLGYTPSVTGDGGYDSNGAYIMNGGGTGIKNSTDQFRFFYQAISNDGQIVARLNTSSGGNSDARAGLMMRYSTGNRTKFAAVVYNPSTGNVEFLVRTANNANLSTIATTSASLAKWLKLTRVGNSYSAFTSSDGVTWTQLGTAQTFTMNTSVLYGMAVTGGQSTAVNTAKFDNVSVNNNLAAPGSFSATPQAGGGMQLSWSNVTGNAGYVVERSYDGATYEVAGTPATNVTTFSDSGLDGSHTYFYRVRTKNSWGNSVPGSLSTLTRPDAPDQLTVSSWTSSQLILNWVASSGATSYNILRSTDGVNYTSIATPGEHVNSYTDSGLSTGTTYYYKVIATNASGDSSAATYTQSTRLPAVTGLAFDSASSSAVAFHWTDVNAGETGYEISRSTDGVNYSVLTTVSGTTNTYTDNTVSPLTQVYYRVTAVKTGVHGQAGGTIFTAVPATSSLPSPWSTVNTGTNYAYQTAAGENSGTFTLIGSGYAFWPGTGSDEFRYVYQSWTGDGEIVAKVEGFDTTSRSSDAKIGIMVRDGTAGNAPHVSLLETPAIGTRLYSRATTSAGNVDYTTTSTGNWLKLTRVGNVFTAYTSPDGSSWTQFSQVTVSMGSTVNFGLVVSAVNTTVMEAATFSNVSVGSVSMLRQQSFVALPQSTFSNTPIHHNSLIDDDSDSPVVK